MYPNTYLMKKLTLILFCFMAFCANGQSFSYNFEDTSYRPVITIDTVNYHHNNWQVGKPNKTVFDSALTLPNALVTDTANPYRANDTSVFYIKLPKYIGFNWFGGVSFFYQLDIDTNAKATVEASSDTGRTWINVVTQDVAHPLQWDATKPRLDTSTNGWQEFSLRFPWGAFFTGDSVFLRFTFISGSNDSSKDGWMIDNLGIHYDWEGAVPQIANNNLFSIYPNPSKGTINIHTNKQGAGGGSVSVTDMMGKEVYKIDKLPQSGQLNLQIPNGTYLLKYSAGDEYGVQRVEIITR